jgi:hypothetical protein
VERCFIFHINDGGSRRRGAVEARRPMHVDGLAQEDGTVWRRDGVDGRPSKVGASVPALEMDSWKTAAAASESAPDRCVTQSQYVAGLGHSASLQQGDTSSDRCCQDDGFRLTDVLLCKIFVNN